MKTKLKTTLALIAAFCGLQLFTATPALADGEVNATPVAVWNSFSTTEGLTKGDYTLHIGDGSTVTDGALVIGSKAAWITRSNNSSVAAISVEIEYSLSATALSPAANLAFLSFGLASATPTTSAANIKQNLVTVGWKSATNLAQGWAQSDKITVQGNTNWGYNDAAYTAPSSGEHHTLTITYGSGTGTTTYKNGANLIAYKSGLRGGVDYTIYLGHRYHDTADTSYSYVWTGMTIHGIKIFESEISSSDVSTSYSSAIELGTDRLLSREVRANQTINVTITDSEAQEGTTVISAPSLTQTALTVAATYRGTAVTLTSTTPSTSDHTITITYAPLAGKDFTATAATGTFSGQDWTPTPFAYGTLNTATLNAPNAADITFSDAATLGKLTVSGAGATTFTVADGIANPVITAYNFSTATGKTTLNYATGTSAITAGSDTVLNGTGTGLITLPANGKATVGNNHFGGNLTVSGGGSVVGPNTSALVFDLGEGNTQTILGDQDTTAGHLFGLTVKSGTLLYSKNSKYTAFWGRTITADGDHAVVKIQGGDATGWDGGCTKIVLNNGGTFAYGYRDTTKVPFDLCRGTVRLLQNCGNSGRAFDLFGNNNWHIIGATGATAEDPTVSQLAVDSHSNNDDKVLIRDGAWNITVDETALFDVYATIIQKGSISASGTPGKLIKKGAGKLVLKASNTYDTGTEVQAGTLKAEATNALGTGAVSVSSGATLELAGNDSSYNFSIADRQLKGTLIIGSGATYTAVTGDSVNYDGTGDVKVYGTLNMGEKRWTYKSTNKLYTYAGATISGAGDQHGAIDFNQGNTLYAKDSTSENKTVTISAPMKIQGNMTFDVDAGVTLGMSCTINYANSQTHTKSGAGTLELTGTPTNPGNAAWTVSAGTLKVPAGKLAGAVTLNSGATLNITGTEGAESYVITSGTFTNNGGTLKINGQTLAEAGYVQVGGTIYVAASASRNNPVTGTAQTFNYAFKGEDGAWATTSNWRTLADGALKPYTGSTSPMLPDSGAWYPTLVDGALFTEKAVSVTEIEGWNGRLAVMGGANVTVGTWHKLGGGSEDNWIWVDTNSTLTISALSTTKNSDHDMSYYVANENGLTFTPQFTEDHGRSGRTYYYYLTGDGTVNYAAGVTAGTHKIKQLEVQVGVTKTSKKVLKQKLITLGGTSTENLFSADANITATCDNPSAPNPTYSSTRPTTDNDVGTYSIEQEADGVYAYVVAYFEAPTGDIHATVDHAISWSNIIWYDAQEQLIGKVTDFSQIDSATLTITGTGTVTVDNATTLASVTSKLTVTGGGTLAYDGATVTTFPTAAPGGLSAAAWTGTVELKGYTFNGNQDLTNYGNAGSKVRMVTCQGYMPQTSKDFAWTLVLENGTGEYGLNVNNGWSSSYMKFAAIEGSGTLKMTKPSSGGAPNIQYIFKDASNFSGSITIETSGNQMSTVLGSDFTPDYSNYHGKILVTGTATLASGKTWSAVGGVVVDGTLNSNGTLSSAVSGSGTLVYSGALPSDTVKTALQADAWTGTLWLKSYNWNTFDFGTLGNLGSKVKLTGVTGYAVNASKTCNTELVLEDDGDTKALTINNGWSGGEYAYTIAKLSGTGTWQGVGNIAQNYVVTDGTGFSGNINLSNGTIVIFGTTYIKTVYQAGGFVYVEPGKAAVVASEKTWTANGGIRVDGSISGAGTLASATTFGDGAEIATTNGTLTASGTLTFGENTKVRVTTAPAAGNSLKVINKTDAGTEAVVTTVTVYEGDSDEPVADRDFDLAYNGDGLYLNATAKHTHLGWSGTAWTNGVGEVVSPITSKHILDAKADDNISFSTAAAPYAFHMPHTGTVTVNNQNNLTVTSIDIPAAATLVLGSNAVPGFGVTGTGTLKYGVGTGSDANEVTVAQLANFHGMFWMSGGRHRYGNAAIVDTVTLKVTQGAQLMIEGTTATTWNNRMILSGTGWTGGSQDIERTALRIHESGPTLGSSCEVTFVTENNTLTQIGCGADKTIEATFKGDGFKKVAGNTMKFTNAAVKAAAMNNGEVVIGGGTIQLGDKDSGGISAGYEMHFGTNIVVNSGTTLKLHPWTTRAQTFNRTDKVILATPVTLNGGAIYTNDGAYYFDSLTAVGSSGNTVTFKYNKSQGFGALYGAEGSALTIQRESSESFKQWFAVDGGDFNGTFTFNNSDNSELSEVWLGVKGADVFADATLNLTGNGKPIYTVLRDNVTLGTVGGTNAGGIFGLNDATYTLTLKGGTISSGIKDSAEGVSADHPLFVTIAGDVTFAAANSYSGTTTVSSGSLVLSGSGTIGTGNYSVANGATLNLGQIRPSGNLLASSQGTVIIKLNEGTENDTFMAGQPLSILPVEGDTFMGTLTVYDAQGSGHPLQSVTIENNRLVITKASEKVQPFNLTNPTGSAVWTAAGWMDSAAEPVAVESSDWDYEVAANIALASGGTATRTLDRAIQISTLNITNAGTLAIADANTYTLTATTIDDSASTGTTTLNFAPGAATITAGKNTIVNKAGTDTGSITVASGMKATVPAWYFGHRTVLAGGYLKITGDVGERELSNIPSNGATIELADTATIYGSFASGVANTKIVVSGDNIVTKAKQSVKLVNNSNSIFEVAGGTFTLQGRAMPGQDGKTTTVLVSGGELTSVEWVEGETTFGGFWYPGGAYDNGKSTLTLSGSGSFTAPYEPYNNGQNCIKNHDATINVGDTAVFAPTLIGYITSGDYSANPNWTTDVADSKHRVNMTGGTFNVPAGVPNWLPINVNGSATIGVQTGVTAPVVRSTITVAANQTATFSIPANTTLEAKSLAGSGTFAISGAGTLDIGTNRVSTINGGNVAVTLTDAEATDQGATMFSGNATITKVMYGGAEITSKCTISGGTVKVNQGECEATVGTVYYLTLAGAISQATADSTVTLCKDVATGTTAITIEKNLTFDGASYEITGIGFNGSGKLTVIGGKIGVTDMPSSYELKGGKYKDNTSFTAVASGYRYVEFATAEGAYAYQVVFGSSEGADEKVYTVTGGTIAASKTSLETRGYTIPGGDVQTFLNGTGANKVPNWQNVVLDLKTDDATSIPVVAPQQTAPDGKIDFKLGGVTVDTASGATVTYKVQAADSPSAETWTDKTEYLPYTSTATITLEGSGVKYYRFDLLVTPAK